MVRVAIIDDNPKYRERLAKLLGKEPDITVVAETDLAGVKKVEEQKPDVILLDNKKPFTDCLEATETIVAKFDNTRVIVLSMDSKTTILPHLSKHTLEGSLCQTGACFHLCHSCSPQEILAAIRNGP
jgi:DNA-binding NarL/FixJ family response regulator